MILAFKNILCELVSERWTGERLSLKFSTLLLLDCHSKRNPHFKHGKQKELYIHTYFCPLKIPYIGYTTTSTIAAFLHDISNDIQNIPTGKFHFRDIFSDKGNWNTQENSEKSKLVFKR